MESREAGSLEGARGAESPHGRRRGMGVFCPHRMVDTVTEVDPKALWDSGLRGLILDLDNTLVRWRREEMDEEVIAWLETVKAQGIQMCVLSNSYLSKRSVRISERLGCYNVRSAQKPRRHGFRRAMELMGTKPTTTAIVGDQVFTDILGGNRTGIYTILVKPIHTHEFVYTRLVARPPERLLLRYFRNRGQI